MVVVEGGVGSEEEQGRKEEMTVGRDIQGLGARLAESQLTDSGEEKASG